MDIPSGIPVLRNTRHALELMTMGYESDEIVDKYGDQEEPALARALIDNVEGGSYRVAIRQLMASEANIRHACSFAAFEPSVGLYQAELHKRDDLFNQAIRDFFLLEDQYKETTPRHPHRP